MKPNTIITNDATIQRNFITENGGMILAWREHSHDEYVTWYYDGKDLNTTCWGHYFDSYEKASKDFFERAKLLNKEEV